jgi:hypothetical protein
MGWSSDPPGLHRVEDALVRIEGGEHHHAGMRAFLPQPLQHRDSIQHRHFQIEQQHIRGQPPDLFDGYRPISGLAHHLGLSRGILISRLVPSPGQAFTTTCPPSSRTRSLIPIKP